MTEYREQINDDETGLPANDPNVAAADHGEDGVVNHEDHLGGFIDEATEGDESTARADALTATGEPDMDSDDEPDDGQDGQK